MGRPPGTGNYYSHKEYPLFDDLRTELDLKSDGRLCELLKISRSTMSKVRHGTNEISAEIVLRIHKYAGWPLEKIEKYLTKDIV